MGGGGGGVCPDLLVHVFLQTGVLSQTDCAVVFVNRHLFFDSPDNTKHPLKWCTAEWNQAASPGDLKRDALLEMSAICHAVSGTKTGLNSYRKA